MDMIACPACGTESKAGTKFCRHCGKEIPASAAMDGQSTIAMGAMTPPPPANDPLKTVVAGMAAVPPRPTAPPAQATVAMGAVTAPPPANDPNKTVVAGMSAVPPASTAPAGGDATVAMGAVSAGPTPPASKPSLAKPNEASQNDPLKTVVAGMAAVPTAANQNYGGATVLQSAQTGASSPNYGDPQSYSQQYPPAQPAQPPSNKGGSKIVYILLALVALGFLAGVGLLIVFIILGSMNAKSTPSSAKPSPTSSPTAPSRTGGVNILDKKITDIDLCGYTVKPLEDSSFDESKAGTRFPITTRMVRLRMKGDTDSTAYQVTWKVGSRTILDQSVTPRLSSKTGRVYFLTLFLTSDQALPSGEHVVELKDNDATAAEIHFFIGS